MTLCRCLIATLWLCGISPAAFAGPPVPPWESGVLQDHPLVGKIWQPAAKGFADPERLLAALQDARFVLLGEKHDNPDHHRLQAWLLEAMIARGRRPAVAFEMLDRKQQVKLDAHLAARPQDAAGIGPAVGWDQTGWPAWSLYQPIAVAALGVGLPLRAGSLPRGEIRALAKEGLSRLGDDRLAGLALDQDLPPDDSAALRQEIVEVHCNMLPDSMIGPMVTVTRVKDAEMADRLIRAAAPGGSDGALLIAGFGHTRADRGVPWYLRQRAPAAATLSLAFLEVAAGEANPESYAATLNAAALPFDYVWFTPRLDDKDPCEVYADQLKKAGEGQKETED